MTATGGSRTISIEAKIEHTDRMQHVARVGGFEFLSDEPPSIEGDDEFPYPLHYMVASVGMCILTQLIRYANVLDVSIQGARAEVVMDWSSSGSARNGSLKAHVHGAAVRLEVESDDAEDRIAGLIKIARNACYAEAALAEPMEVSADVVLNGAAFDVTAFPTLVERRAEAKD